MVLSSLQSPLDSKTNESSLPLWSTALERFRWLTAGQYQYIKAATTTAVAVAAAAAVVDWPATEEDTVDVQPLLVILIAHSTNDER